MCSRRICVRGEKEGLLNRATRLWRQPPPDTVHLTAEQVETLFGKGHKLTVKKMLSQPGQFACEEKVDVVGPEKHHPQRIGSRPRAESGAGGGIADRRPHAGHRRARCARAATSQAPGVKLVGPAGELTLAQGVIAAKRHIHLTPDEAAAFGLADKEIVTVRLDTARPLIFDDVVVRVRSDFAAAMHIDTDESNAACAFGEVYGEIRKK